jgi:hypothetical protein
VAIDYANRAFPDKSQAPEAVVARPITNEELTGLGLPSGFFLDCIDPPPMMLVILKGDFDISGLSRSIKPAQSPARAKYILYVYDLREGAPTLITASVNGGAFRRALNDPSIPDDPTVVPAPSGPTAQSKLPPLPTPSRTRVCQTDLVAPTASP